MTEPSPARVLDVGQCPPDHAAIRAMIEQNFFAQVDAVATIDEAQRRLRKPFYDLVLVNRVIDADGRDGLELIRQAKREELDVPIMLVSNYDEAQLAAVAGGGVPGFGKDALDEAGAYEHLARFLPVKTVRAT